MLPAFLIFLCHPQVVLEACYVSICNKVINRSIQITESRRPTVSGIVEYRKCFTEARAIRVAVDNVALVNSTLSVTATHVIVGYHDEMDAANTGEWLGDAGTMDESFCMASEGSFVSGELAYAEAQSTVDCSAPSEVQKNFAGQAGDSNRCAFAMIKSRDCARIG